jgi:hypothetical protein
VLVIEEAVYEHNRVVAAAVTAKHELAVRNGFRTGHLVVLW